MLCGVIHCHSLSGRTTSTLLVIALIYISIEISGWPKQVKKYTHTHTHHTLYVHIPMHHCVWDNYYIVMHWRWYLWSVLKHEEILHRTPNCLVACIILLERIPNENQHVWHDEIHTFVNSVTLIRNYTIWFWFLVASFVPLK